jgi:hypothetical protein
MFVGSVVFVVDVPVGPHVRDAIHAEIGRLPGISFCGLDDVAGTLVVTAETPVDRTDVVALLDRLGCRVRA